MSKLAVPDKRNSPQVHPSAVMNERNDSTEQNHFTHQFGRLSPAIEELNARNSKAIVDVGVNFIKIGEIDTLKEQYAADIIVHAKWREPELDFKTKDELKTASLSKFWNPKLVIENALVEQKIQTFRTVWLNRKGEAFVVEQRKVRGVFYENLELEHFPFDIQDLSITVVSERSGEEVELFHDCDSPSCVNMSMFAEAQKWQLRKKVSVTKRIVSINVGCEKREHSALQATCQAARRPGFFLYNVYLVIFLISSISFGTFSVDCGLVQNRLQVTYTLLLTSITFKMVVNQSLPKISYLTYMDKYILMSLVFLVLVCIWHSIAPFLPLSCSNSHGFDINNMEDWVIVVFFALYIGGHVIYVWRLYVNVYRRRSQLSAEELHGLAV